MRKYAWLALVVWGAAAVATAQLSPEYKDWPNGPAGFLLTKAEKKEYQGLTGDSQANAWIELFWAKRDPNLETVGNEFKMDFDSKVVAADKQFSTEKLKGSLSDRGKTLILLGKPQKVAGTPAGAAVGQPEMGGVSQEERGAGEVWVYTKAMLPEAVRKEFKADEIRFFFFETRVGIKDFALDRASSSNSMALKLLGVMPEALVANPKLTEVPRIGLIDGSKAATPAQLAVLTAEPGKWPEGAVKVVTWGFQREATQALWVYIQLPDAVPAATQAIGRIRNAESGAEQGTFAANVQPLSVRGARAYEFAVQLAPGAWAGEIALLAGTDVVAVTPIEGTIPPLQTEGTQFSPFYWTVDVRQDPTGFGHAYNIGGWHAVPRPVDTYMSSEMQSFDLFVFVVRPPLGEDGKPKQFDLSLQLFVGDKPGQQLSLGQHAPNELPGTGLYFLGVPLPQLQKPGDFRFDVTFKEASSNLTHVAKIPFKIVAEQPAAAPATAK
jgi:GWxTD domain-containing protein